MTPPCIGRERLFDSTLATDHLEARALCNACPVLEACRQRLAEAQSLNTEAKCGPAGTWAGQLVGGKRNQAAVAEADGRWSNEAARSAHNRWNNGLRDPVTAEGERVYQRRRAVRRRAA